MTQSRTEELNTYRRIYELNSTPFKNNTFQEDEKVSFADIMFIQNNLYESKDYKHLLEFYNIFNNEDEIVKWMKRRPSGTYRLKVVFGDPDIVVVIPTIDHENRFSNNCLNNIFKGLTIIFVESGKNLYFNFAHNVNAGISKAIELGAKWIIVSNDDKNKVDESNVLVNELSSLDNNLEQILVPRTDHGGYIMKYRKNTELIKPILKSFKPYFSVEEKFGIYYRFYIYEKSLLGKIISRLFLKKIVEIKFLGSFFILSSNYCKNNNNEVFDETYVNGFEDVDLALRQIYSNNTIKGINYAIGDIGGQSLGTGELRSHYRGILNRTYFNWKDGKMLNKMLKSPGFKH